MSGATNRDPRLLAGAVGMSALGDFLALIPLALMLEQETGSGFVVAALFVALWCPVVVLAAPAGLLVDTCDPRRVLAIVSVAQAAVAASLAFAGSPGQVIALTTLLGAGAAVGQPAEFAIAPRLAGAGRAVATINGRLETARYAGFTLGPLLGGALAAGGGTRVALLVDAASFVAVALVALAIRIDPAPVRPTASAESGRGRAGDGFALLRRDAVLRAVLPVAFVSLLFMTATATAEVFFANDVLDAGAAGYGALTSAWAAGMVAGAVLLAPRVGSQRAVGFALTAIAVQGLGIALPALWLVLPFALAVYVVGGLAHGVKNVVLRTLIHERAPAHLHGRAFAAYNAIRNAAELAALTGGGLLVGTIGARSTLVVAGGVPVLAAVAAAARSRSAPATTPSAAASPRPC